jgi:dihydropyrimidine dehydrogenase (NADP+)
VRVHSLCLATKGRPRKDTITAILLHQVVVKDGKIKALELFRTEQNEAVCRARRLFCDVKVLQDEWIEDPEQLIRLKADFIISAFGSELGFGEVADALSPVTFHKWGSPIVDPVTMATSEPGVFCGGDIGGVANVCFRCLHRSIFLICSDNC